MAEPEALGRNRFSTMAHLFLSDVRSEGIGTDPVGDDGPGSQPGVRVPPKRVAPKKTDNPNPPPRPADRPEGVDLSGCLPTGAGPSRQADYSSPENHIPKRPRVLAVYAHHLGQEADIAIDQFARSLAGPGTIVGVLQLTAGGAEAAVYAPASAVHEEWVLSRLDPWANGLDYLLLTWDPELSRYEDPIRALLDEVCVVASPEREALIGAYQVLKRLGPRLGEQPAGVFVTGAATPAEAEATLVKLTKTALDFARLDLKTYGYRLAAETVVRKVSVAPGSVIRGREWFASLQRWLMERKAGKMPETDIDPVGDSERPEDQPDDELVLVDFDGSDPISVETLGRRLLPGHRAVRDSLAAFLRSCGLNGMRFQAPDGRGTWVLVVQSPDQTVDVLWAAGHYPDPDDRVLLVTDQPMGKLERSVWTRYFPDVRILPMLSGMHQGRPVWVVKR